MPRKQVSETLHMLTGESVIHVRLSCSQAWRGKGLPVFETHDRIKDIYYMGSVPFHLCFTQLPFFFGIRVVAPNSKV